MFCNKCGKEIEDGASFCGNCGNVIDTREINFSDVTNYAGQQMNKAVEGAKAQFNASREAYQKEQNEQKNVAELIIDPQEQQIAVIGSSYLDSLLHGGGLSKGFGILTDKRFYFKGKSFTKTLGQRVKIDQEYTVDLENITASGFVYIQKYWLIVLSVLSLIFGIVNLVRDRYTRAMGITGVILAIVFIVAYFLTKRVYYDVYFEGGVVSVDVSKYGGIKEVRAFNKALRMEKDKRK